MAALESNYQHNLIKRLKVIFPEIEILKNDSSYKKSIPDLTLFYKDKYALLEVKRSKKDYEKSLNEDERKNQEYYINKFNKWSYASFIFPENEDEVILELKEVFNS